MTTNDGTILKAESTRPATSAIETAILETLGTSPRTSRAEQPGTLITVPADTKTILLPVHRNIPERKTGSVAFDDLKDFCAFVAEHSNPHRTRLFMEQTDRGILVTALLDFHEAKHEDPEIESLPGWGAFSARLDVGLSEELLPWIAFSRNAQGLDQETFANFIDDNCASVSTPEPAKLVEIAIALQGAVGAQFDSKINRQIRGDVTLNFQQTTDIGTVKVPTEIVLRCPVFAGGPDQAITTKLQFQIQSGRPRFFIRLPALAQILRDATRRSRDLIHEALQLPVYYAKAPTGMPEPEQAVLISTPLSPANKTHPNSTSAK